nr:thioredoxin protein 1 [Hymenolepis microstoma]
MTIRLVSTDTDFNFYATWCRACTDFDSHLIDLSKNYPFISFIKVDVDTCPETVASYGVDQIPTLIIVRHGKPLTFLPKPSSDALKVHLQELVKSSPSNSASSSSNFVPSVAPMPGLVDLSDMIDSSRCECLNCHSDHGLECALTKDMTYLMSDADEQLILFLTFNQIVKLHSLRITAPADSGPRNIKIFTNQLATPDFDACEAAEAVQAFTLAPEDLHASSLIQLKFVKFQNVNSVTIFVQDNQEGVEQTRITNLILYGCPINNVTNMNEFKRVAGQKGEAHG